LQGACRVKIFHRHRVSLDRFDTRATTDVRYCCENQS
jgi:hypothetical protein